MRKVGKAAFVRNFDDGLVAAGKQMRRPVEADVVDQIGGTEIEVPAADPRHVVGWLLQWQ